jgi:hypothetical protein
MKTGGVNEDNLSLREMFDPDDPRASGLRARGDDGHLLAEEGIQ